MRLWLRVFLFILKPTPPTRRQVVIVGFCACIDTSPTSSTYFHVLSTLLVRCHALAMWRVLCFYMSAAKHFGFVRSCLAAIFGYFFILLGNIYRLSLV